MPLPRIAITIGDPAGVGPELSLRLAANLEISQQCVPILFGDRPILEQVAKKLGIALPQRCISWEMLPTLQALEPTIVDFAEISPQRLEPGRISAESGAAAYRYLAAAIEAAMAGWVDAIATGPLNKKALELAGILYPGHTEILAAQTGAENVRMLMTSRQMSCCLVTTHVGYTAVPQLLTVDAICQTISLGGDVMRRLLGREPRILVCGLNPHAGEGGLFGNGEEERLITPAIQAARQAGWNVRGPLPPDTAFIAANRVATDLFICMYHDQGLIPLKALAFDSAVNVTLGLPIVRTSVDHGTACDIAWQGIADVNSFVEAVRMAIRLIETRSS